MASESKFLAKEIRLMVNRTLVPGHALRRPWRPDLRVTLGIVLILVSVGGSLSFWSSATDTRALLMAARDLPAGATVGADDLTVARVRVDETIYSAALPATEEQALLGKQLSEPVHAGQLIVREQIASRPLLGPGQVALT